MYELVIFDCDGVLVDSEPTSNRVFAEELSRLGVDWSPQQVARRLTGLSDRSCVELLIRETGHDLPVGFLDRVHSRTYAAFKDGLQPISGIRTALERIDLPTCVASSGEHERIRLSLELTGLLEYFEGRIFSASDVPRGKPHPDLFLHSARAMGVEPSRAVVVEDSLPGIRAGQAAGMKVLAYVGPSGDGPYRDGGVCVFHDMSRLPELISQGNDEWAAEALR